MTRYALRLLEDQLQADIEAPASLPAVNRVVYVVEGEVTITAGDEVTEVSANAAWCGPDPVYTAASDAGPAAFVRVMILPRVLKDKSSIRYVKPEDQDKPKPQRYTMFLDEDIAV